MTLSHLKLNTEHDMPILRQISQLGHPVLRGVAEKIADPQAPEIQAIIDDLLATAADAQGRISRRTDAGPSAMIQRLKLEAEGVEFDEQGRIPLHYYQWRAEPPLSLDNGEMLCHGFTT